MARKDEGQPGSFAALDATIRAICLALPGTKVTLTWGKPHYRVGEKIFAGANDEGGRLTVGFKLDKGHAAELVQRDPRFRVAPYVGKHGWVEMELGPALQAGTLDEAELRGYLLESYRRIAPKRLLARIGVEAPLARLAPSRTAAPRARSSKAALTSPAARRAARPARRPARAASRPSPNRRRGR